MYQYYFVIFSLDKMLPFRGEFINLYYIGIFRRSKLDILNRLVINRLDQVCLMTIKKLHCVETGSIFLIKDHGVEGSLKVSKNVVMFLLSKPSFSKLI